MRLLLDTNVVVSAILFGGLPRRILMRAVRGELLPVTSPVLLDELEELLAEKFGFSAEAARETRRELEWLAEVVEPVEIPEVCRDPDDNQVLAAAAAGDAVVIVTGDEDLIAVGTYEGVEILRPAQFVGRSGRSEP